MTPSAEQLAKLAAVIRSPHTDRGLLARVRRAQVHPQELANGFDLQTLLFKAGIDPLDFMAFQDWALIAHSLALVNGAHNPNASSGEQLARLPLSEMRMRMLVEADHATLFDLLPRLARRVAGAAALNWWMLARLVLLARTAPDQAEAARRHLIAGYLNATSQATHG